MYADTKKRRAEKTVAGGAKKQKVSKNERDPKSKSKQALAAAKAEVM